MHENAARDAKSLRYGIANWQALGEQLSLNFRIFHPEDFWGYGLSSAAEVNIPGEQLKKFKRISDYIIQHEGRQGQFVPEDSQS